MDKAETGAPATGWTIDDLRRATAHALGLGQWDLDDEADLLEHGLDSLRMMRLAGALRTAGYDIPLPDLAERPTVSAWFELLRGIEGGDNDRN